MEQEIFVLHSSKVEQSFIRANHIIHSVGASMFKILKYAYVIKTYAHN